jgi:hypothetical protein
MKRNEVTVGMKVAVNDLPDGMVYTVKEISDNGLGARLTYKTKQGRVCGGFDFIDICYLRTPTKAQIANNPLQD